tara:strand:+ start:521 stop:868 length:348 start_codon:yes stop_codon:yes gene_type:complete
MKKIMTIISILFALLTFDAQAQDNSQTRKNSNVWVNECKSCHPSYEELAKQTGIKTEQYLFNYVYFHKNKDGKEFGTILSKKEISFVSRFVLIAAYLHKLETDMRKAGDHLIKKL